VPPAIHSLEVASRTPSGRVAQLRLTGSGGFALQAATLRRAIGHTLGWDLVRSDLYEVRDAGERFAFHGYGSGHGVGLCQAGAAAMGNAQKSYKEILSYYYPGTSVGLTAQGLDWHALAGARADLLTTQPNEHQPLLTVAERIMTEAESQTNWAYTSRPQLKVYPSVGVFRDATGEPGWVAASTRGRIVRLQPPEVLRRVGTLESTLRHELFHLLVESHAKPGTALWLREGLVLALSEHGPAAFRPAAFADSGSLESALAHPRSRDEIERAYDAARSRVANLIAQYGKQTVLSWIERGSPPEIR
jgi:stage II sporulation protein D